MHDLFHNVYGWGNNILTPSTFGAKIREAITLPSIEKSQFSLCIAQICKE